MRRPVADPPSSGDEWRGGFPRTLSPPRPKSSLRQRVRGVTKAFSRFFFRTGQRIGDWKDGTGKHGILGMTLADLDQRRSMITVRLKGARDEHRVPVTEDFWPMLRNYLDSERIAHGDSQALWIGLRRGSGEPLTYAAFEASLRYVSRKAGIRVHAHMFRHLLARPSWR